MNQWQNGQSDAGFSNQSLGHINPSMFNNLNPQAQFDLSSAGLPFAQQQPGLPNGGPVYPGQTFQPNSVVPQKRQHDGSGMSGSPPPPNPNTQASRAQTPNFAAPYNTSQPAQQFGNSAIPSPYTHLQQTGSNHATPSPTMQNQPFRQPSRMSNASPSPFPPNQASFNGQMNTTAQNMSQQAQMAALNQQFNMNASMVMPNMQNAMQAQPNSALSQHQLNQQRQYQQRLMAHQAQLRVQQEARQNGGAMNNPAAVQNSGGLQNPMQQPSGIAGVPNNQASVLQARRTQFLNQCANILAKMGRQFNPNPAIAGKPVDLFSLFNTIAGAQGSSNIERNQQWQAVANKLGFGQMPNAAEEIKAIFVANVAPYERMWIQARAASKQEEARKHAQQMAGNQTSPTKMQPNTAQLQQQLAQQQQRQQQFAQLQQQQQAQQAQSTPQPMATPIPANASIPNQNGMSTPQQQQQQMSMGGPGSLQHRRSSSMMKQMTPQPPAQSPVAKVQHSPAMKPEPITEVVQPQQELTDNYTPSKVVHREDGGLVIKPLFDSSSIVLDCMPRIPIIPEMGLIDIRAITLSLASGIHAEVRYALDTLSRLSADGRIPFELSKCDDLVDVLIDCGQDNVDILLNNSDETSATIVLPSYESVVRAAREEVGRLQDVPSMGSIEYEMDRAVDRVIAITTILRNLACIVINGYPDVNTPLLIVPQVIKFLSSLIRHIGTRKNFLRNQINLQDVYKDLTNFFSHITQALELPSREDALNILHLLLVFAPEPTPQYSTAGGKLTFSPYDPKKHKYLAFAIDCLAKLLARQDPNRVFYRSIFTATASSSEENPADLLTCAFALAISVLPPVPVGALGYAMQLRIVEARKSSVMQGMLAADILATMLPANASDGSEMARAWVESDDGWAANLLSLASVLSVPQTPRMVPGQRDPPMSWDGENFRTIAHRALSMLKKLAEKAGRATAKRLIVDGNNKVATKKALTAQDIDSTGGVSTGDGMDADDLAEVDAEPYAVKKFDGLPQGHAILGALMLQQIDPVPLRVLCALHDLASQG